MLKKVKWNNYKALGNLDLDFRKPDGSAYSTIILAGENGTGKTTILETLGQFLTGHSIVPFSYLEYEISGKDFWIEPVQRNANLGFHTRKDMSNGRITQVTTNFNNSPDKMQNDENDLRSYGCVYSMAKSQFQTQNIQGITTQQLDANKYEFDSKNDFTEIKQLLVDIDAQDAKEYRRINQTNNISLSEFEPQSKMYRFKSAFNSFFDNIQFDRIDDSLANLQRIIFKKHGIDILIDDLSTGEKQIVFRGTYLLKNSNAVSHGIILIDEPELSMHPTWQQKILSFYKNLFMQNGEQKAQIIMATHSEYVVRKALEDKDNTLVIILKDENGVIEQTRAEAPHLLLHLTSAEINFKAFGIYSIDYHVELYGRLQAKTGCNTINDMDDYIRRQSEYNSNDDKNALRNGNTITETLPTYIRNTIDHPENPSRSYNNEELKKSTDILINLIEALL